jgi:cation transport ATPase
MSTSSLIVVLNALRLRAAHLDVPETGARP